MALLLLCKWTCVLYLKVYIQDDFKSISSTMHIVLNFPHCLKYVCSLSMNLFIFLTRKFLPIIFIEVGITFYDYNKMINIFWFYTWLIITGENYLSSYDVSTLISWVSLNAKEYLSFRYKKFFLFFWGFYRISYILWKFDFIMLCWSLINY